MNSPSKIANIGFIGVGNIALDHAKVINELGHNIVAGTCTNKNSSRWKNFKIIAPNAIFISEIDELLLKDNIDTIIVCLPWFATEKILHKLLLSLKNILIEKPISLSSNLLERTLKLPGINLSNKTIGLNRRFYSSVQTLKKRVDKGGVKFVEVSISESVKWLEKKISPSILPNILVYNSCHILDTLIYLLGELETITRLPLQGDNSDSSFHSSFNLLKTKNNAPVSLLITDENPLPVGIRVLFDDETTWHLSPIEELNIYKGYDISEPNEEINIRRYTPHKKSSKVVNCKLKPGFYEQMQYLLEEKNTGIGSTFYQHLNLLKFIESLSCK